MKMTTKKKLLIILGIIIVMVGTLMSSDYFITINTRDKQEYVAIKAPKDGEIIFFYRDDCPHCRKVFPDVFHEKKLGKNIKLVNMNNRRNRKYITQYYLKTVPSYAVYQKNGDYKLYHGTKKSTLKKVLGE